MRSHKRYTVVFLGTLMTGFISQSALADNNIVVDTVSAPVVTNGINSNAPTEFNIILDATGTKDKLSLDNQHFGHQIPAGGKLVLELGGTFSRNPGFENRDGGTNLLANRNLIMTIAPQNPIIAPGGGAGVQYGNWSLSDDGRTITVTPQGGSGDYGLEGARANDVGVKVIHLRPDPGQATNDPKRAPFFNGAPGTKGTITVTIFDSAGNVVESGTDNVIFRAGTGPQVYNTNIGVRTTPGGNPAALKVEDTNFQRVAPNTVMNNEELFTANPTAPKAPRFILFAAAAANPDPFIPQIGIGGVGYVVKANNPRKADIVQESNGNGVPDAGDTRIGSLDVTGPGGVSMGTTILPNSTLTPAAGDGSLGSANGSVMAVYLKTGSQTGITTLRARLDNGGEAKNYIIVE